MALNTTTGTYLADLFNPQVIGDMINEKLYKNIVFAPLATIDYALQGRAGDTVTLPYFEALGDAEEVTEGNDIPIKKLSEKTKQVQIKKIGLGVTLTDEAILSGYGDPINEATTQIVTSIASKVDNMLLGALDGNDKNVYNLASSTFDPAEIPYALKKFGEEITGEKVIIVDPDAYAELVNVKSWVPASDIAAGLLIQGSVGMAYGVQIIVSERVTDTYHIVKPGALALFMKRDVLVETDRDVVNQSNVIVGSKLFAPYLYKPSNAIKLVKKTS
jgi:N4-gp56 family major capsid protein